MRLPSAFAAAAAVFWPELPIKPINGNPTPTPSIISSTAAFTSTPVAISTFTSTKSTPAPSTTSTSATASATVDAIPKPKLLLSNAANLAASLVSNYPNPNIALLPEPIWWWQSGSAVDGLLTYTTTTGDRQYTNLLQDTLLSECLPTQDFMTPHATGNDDQAWWALAALTAAETRFPAKGNVEWVTLARNVFEAQKTRWDRNKCGGGMKWKILEGDGKDGWHYKSTIANGLFFQLAARLALLTGDEDAAAWAEKAYDWTVGVGLIDGDFNVFDGTDDAKGENGCVDVNHDQWSYNVGVFMHGAAVMATHTGDKKWMARTKGFLASAKRNFVNKDTGALFEARCDHDQSCDSDQISFKGTLARWLGATAMLRPNLRKEIEELVVGAAVKAQSAKLDGLHAIEAFNALEIVDAGLRVQGIGSAAGTIARRSVAGRVTW